VSSDSCLFPQETEGQTEAANADEKAASGIGEID
jgi:hypothetical protein